MERLNHVNFHYVNVCYICIYLLYIYIYILHDLSIIYIYYMIKMANWKCCKNGVGDGFLPEPIPPSRAPLCWLVRVCVSVSVCAFAACPLPRLSSLQLRAHIQSRRHDTNGHMFVDNACINAMLTY